MVEKRRRGRQVPRGYCPRCERELTREAIVRAARELARLGKRVTLLAASTRAGYGGSAASYYFTIKQLRREAASDG